MTPGQTSEPLRECSPPHPSEDEDGPRVPRRTTVKVELSSKESVSKAVDARSVSAFSMYHSGHCMRCVCLRDSKCPESAQDRQRMQYGHFHPFSHSRTTMYRDRPCASRVSATEVLPGVGLCMIRGCGETGLHEAATHGVSTSDIGAVTSDIDSSTSCHHGFSPPSAHNDGAAGALGISGGAGRCSQ